MGEVVVGGRRAGADDGVHVGASRGEAAGVRVFEGDGFVAAEAEAVEDEFVEIRLGLGGRDVFATGEECEVVEEAEASEVSVAPRVRGVGREGDRKRASAGGVEEGDDAGQDGLAEHQRVFDGAAFEFESGAIGVRTEAVPRIEGVVGVADAADKRVAVEGHTVIGVNEAVGVDERGLGVEDEAVEVEDEGADHKDEAAEAES